MKLRVLLGFAAVAALVASHAFAQDADEGREPTILKAGSAAEWGVSDGDSAYGATVEVETTPFDGGPEFEFGVSPLFSPGHTEWQTDFALEAPIDLWPWLELNVGAGPEWIHKVGHGRTTDSAAVDASLDFIAWVTPSHDLGVFLEPGYEYELGHEHDQSFTLAAGLAMPI